MSAVLAFDVRFVAIAVAGVDPAVEAWLNSPVMPCVSCAEAGIESFSYICFSSPLNRLMLKIEGIV